MFDPHVDALYYKVSSDEGVSYHEPESISFSHNLGTFDLSDGNLKIVPNEHFASENEAREAFVSFLKEWEIHADLTFTIGMIRFEFDHVEIIDRNPLPPGSPQFLECKTARLNLVAQSGRFHQTYRKYPQPPKSFSATNEVQIAYRRWLNYRRGKEPLQAMAYYVLTLLELNSPDGTRKSAGEKYKISFVVLKNIGELSTKRKHGNSSRKEIKANEKSNKDIQEMSILEEQWLEEAVRLIIHRLGEYASGAPLEHISLDKLPNLN